MLDPQVPQVEAGAGASLVAGGAFLLDVREDNEWAAGHAAAATHIRLAEVPQRVGDVPADRQVVVICRSGARSQRAAEFLRQQGVDALNLAGGMRSWVASELEVVTDSGAPGSVI